LSDFRKNRFRNCSFFVYILSRVLKYAKLLFLQSNKILFKYQEVDNRQLLPSMGYSFKGYSGADSLCVRHQSTARGPVLNTALRAPFSSFGCEPLRLAAVQLWNIRQLLPWLLHCHCCCNFASYCLLISFRV